MSKTLKALKFALLMLMIPVQDTPADNSGSIAVTVTINQPPAQVSGRHIFYNNSAFGDTAAPDKEALLPGNKAVFWNYTSYSRGINGIAVDIENFPDPSKSPNTPPSANPADYFEFRSGNNNNPQTWLPAPIPAAMSVTKVNDTIYRIALTWADGAIVNKWLEIKALANAHTGLAVPDVFYFGNAVAEAGNSSVDANVTVTDLLLARNNPRDFLSPADIAFPYDYNRDKKVDAADVLLARNNQTSFLNALKLIDLAGVPGEALAAPKTPEKRADIDGDGSVGLSDWAILRSAFGSREGEAGYNEDADLNLDGIVDITDFNIFRTIFNLRG